MDRGIERLAEQMVTLAIDRFVTLPPCFDDARLTLRMHAVEDPGDPDCDRQPRGAERPQGLGRVADDMVRAGTLLGTMVCRLETSAEDIRTVASRELVALRQKREQAVASRASWRWRLSCRSGCAADQTVINRQGSDDAPHASIGPLAITPSRAPTIAERALVRDDPPGRPDQRHAEEGSKYRWTNDIPAALEPMPAQADTPSSRRRCTRSAAPVAERCTAPAWAGRRDPSKIGGHAPPSSPSTSDSRQVRSARIRGSSSAARRIGARPNAWPPRFCIRNPSMTRPYPRSNRGKPRARPWRCGEDLPSPHFCDNARFPRIGPLRCSTSTPCSA